MIEGTVDAPGTPAANVKGAASTAKLPAAQVAGSGTTAIPAGAAPTAAPAAPGPAAPGFVRPCARIPGAGRLGCRGPGGQPGRCRPPGRDIGGRRASARTGRAAASGAGRLHSGAASRRAACRFEIPAGTILATCPAAVALSSRVRLRSLRLSSQQGLGLAQFSSWPTCRRHSGRSSPSTSPASAGPRARSASPSAPGTITAMVSQVPAGALVDALHNKHVAAASAIVHHHCLLPAAGAVSRSACR